MQVSPFYEVQWHILRRTRSLDVADIRVVTVAGALRHPTGKHHPKLGLTPLGYVHKPVDMHAAIRVIFERPCIGWLRRGEFGPARRARNPSIETTLEETPKSDARLGWWAPCLFEVYGDKVGEWQIDRLRNSWSVPKIASCSHIDTVATALTVAPLNKKGIIARPKAVNQQV